ncbi:MFS transporter [Sporomusa acidovorans]|uniref:Multidrug resistance protein Stp n=1 Tax=Sporomusa acidovorans (strain ATCC 49682 / DSM 3132 / Mol) TaxID=1123286 RepID=A0ABZ3J176_SPOA4|nr:MFS transporter [Sporomusa acidovorans]OZC15105.1 multidrug resistance protein Stp [Sporomusa acidovorans DSM 3132]SDF86462.1 drug resistance transporter, EmrB/QacA subfamily [Sporomusa acidovorans]
MLMNSKKFWLVIAVFLGTFIGFLDMTIVNVSLPAIQSDLKTSMEGLQWVVNAYAICLAILMLSGGTMGDRYGRKRLWLLGVAVFTIGSAICAWSSWLAMLVSGRIIQGIGAAFLVPGSLSILAQAFIDRSQRAQIIGWWSTINSLATVAGPVLGGILVDEVGWNSIFLINLPLGIAVFLLGIWAIPESKDPSYTSLDPWGQLLGIIWLGSLTYALIMGRTLGWMSLFILILLCVSIIAFLAFVKVELASSQPMLPIRIFTDRRFAVTNAASFVLGFGVLAAYFFLSLYLQQVHGYSASSAGMRLVPFCGTVALFSVISGWLTGRYGPRQPMLFGYLLCGIGLLGMYFFEPNTSYIFVAIIFIVIGIGMGLALPATNSAALAAVPRERSGMASATVNATRQTGATLGIAVMGILFAARSIATLSKYLEQVNVPAFLSRSIAGNLVNHQGIPVVTKVSLASGILEDMYRRAFCCGLHAAMLVGGIVTIIIVAFIWFTDWQCDTPEANS